MNRTFLKDVVKIGIVLFGLTMIGIIIVASFASAQPQLGQRPRIECLAGSTSRGLVRILNFKGQTSALGGASSCKMRMATIAGGSSLNPSARVIAFDDLLQAYDHGVQGAPYAMVVSGSAVTGSGQRVATSFNTSFHRVSSANTTAQLEHSDGGMPLYGLSNTVGWFLESVVKPENPAALGSPFTNNRMNWGIDICTGGSNPDSCPNGAIWIRHDGAENSGKFQCYTCGDNACSGSDLNILPVIGTSYRFRVELVSVGVVKCQIDNAACPASVGCNTGCCLKSSNVEDDGQPWHWGLMVRSQDASERAWDIDYIWYEQTIDRPPYLSTLH